MTEVRKSMSRILVVEPRNMLRQAISLALFPDHEVQMAALWSSSHATLAQEFDLVIIDAGTLRAASTFSSPLIRAVQSWTVPTIWIDDTGAREAPAREGLVVLTGPIQKESLQSAVTKCLGTSSSKRTTSIAAKESMTAKELSATMPQSTSPQIIELVDVVEEPPAPRKNRKQTKTK